MAYIKENLLLSLKKRNFLKTNWGLEIIASGIQILEPYGGQWSVSRSDRFTSGERADGTLSAGDKVVPWPV
jgi:hypothetical protein